MGNASGRQVAFYYFGHVKNAPLPLVEIIDAPLQISIISWTSPRPSHKQEINQGRTAQLENKLARAEVIDVSKLSGHTIKFGATVTLTEEHTGETKVWQIVGEPRLHPEIRCMRRGRST